ncbi:hypothetical protein COP2_007501 [Malus domestica]
MVFRVLRVRNLLRLGLGLGLGLGLRLGSGWVGSEEVVDLSPNEVGLVGEVDAEAGLELLDDVVQGGEGRGGGVRVGSGVVD